jgi:hypothetical protein
MILGVALLVGTAVFIGGAAWLNRRLSKHYWDLKDEEQREKALSIMSSVGSDNPIGGSPNIGRWG